MRKESIGGIWGCRFLFGCILGVCCFGRFGNSFRRGIGRSGGSFGGCWGVFPRGGDGGGRGGGLWIEFFGYLGVGVGVGRLEVEGILNSLLVYQILKKAVSKVIIINLLVNLYLPKIYQY